MTQKREKGSAARVTKFVQEQRVRLIGDARKQIHGYDFCEFLGWFIRQHAGFTAIHPTTIPKYMTAIIERPWLAGEVFSMNFKAVEVLTVDLLGCMGATQTVFKKLSDSRHSS